MHVIDETYQCGRCGDTVNPKSGTCGDIECPLFDPRYETGEEADEPIRSSN